MPGFKFAIDRGGTFTDVWAKGPDGKVTILKLLSEDILKYRDAPSHGIKLVLNQQLGLNLGPNDKIEDSLIDWIKMGTTVATNALLENKGSDFGLIITKGFKETFTIGNQTRMNLFDLNISENQILYKEVIEIDERLIISHSSCQISSDMPSVQGQAGFKLHIMKNLNIEEVKVALSNLLKKGIKNVAIVFVHSYLWNDHEKEVKKKAEEMGFETVLISSECIQMEKLLWRGSTACVDCYLTPLLLKYVNGFLSEFNKLQKSKLVFMQSNGGLTPVHHFTGSKAIISGPSAGVVALAKTSPLEYGPVLGFDMGGTSTDVSRFDGEMEEVLESNINSIKILTPQLHIQTVASGGGSILSFRSGIFYVGPESAGAQPGPLSYRKGGPLTVTDANLFLGRIQAENFPKIFGPQEDQELDVIGVRRAFDDLNKKINKFNEDQNIPLLSAEKVALGFLDVANEIMSRPIRTLTQARGIDCSKHMLNCFGGAGGQHACAIAKNLGISTIYIHRYSSILSAYGLALADILVEEQLPLNLSNKMDWNEDLDREVNKLKIKCVEKLEGQGFDKSLIECSLHLHMKYQGTDYFLIVTSPLNTSGSFTSSTENIIENFNTKFENEFGFIFEKKEVLITGVRVKAMGKSLEFNEEKIKEKDEAVSKKSAKIYLEEKFLDVPVFDFRVLAGGQEIKGPAMLIDANNTILIDKECLGKVTQEGNLIIKVGEWRKRITEASLDPINLSLLSNRFMSIAEQMGRIIQKTAKSTNIKERLDFSCAVFGEDGGLVANAPHIPVHLGSMQYAVQYQLKTLGNKLENGDCILSNHPVAGGSHLPDLTVITPVFSASRKNPVFFVACRGHHSDIGGSTPGSMPPDSKTIYEEGAIFKTFFLVKKGIFQEKELIEMLNAPSSYPRCMGSRNLGDNISDLKAQIAANKKGVLLMEQLVEESSLEVVQFYMIKIQENAKFEVENLIKKMSGGSTKNYHGDEYMDGGFRISLSATFNFDGTAIFDFTKSSHEVLGNLNAPRAVTLSSILYCLRCMVGKEMPLNQGCLEPIKIKIKKNSILDPSDEAAVVGGNVLTSQRVVDLLFKTFGVCAASQGCMNNVSFGDKGMGYYETVGGGSGAGPSWSGRDGVHSHMTNTRITDVEVLETRIPVIIKKFGLVEDSEGDGKNPGGKGIHREYLFRKNFSLSILSERRSFQPYGMAGGLPGKRGINYLVREGITKNLGGKILVQIQPGDVFVLNTPGGGGYGSPKKDQK